MSEILTIDQFLMGLFCVLWVAFGCTSGVVMLSKYRKVKEKTTISIFITMVFLTSPWWGSTVQFISLMATRTVIPELLYVALGQIFLPISLIAWVYTITVTTFPHLLKKIMIVYFLISIVYEIYLVFGLIFNPTDLVGYADPENLLNTSFQLVPLIYSGFAIISMAGIGAIAARILMRSDDENLKWKGRFLLISFISFAIGAILDVGILDEIESAPVRTIIMIIARLLLMSGAVEIYFGYFLPKRIAKIFIKT